MKIFNKRTNASCGRSLSVHHYSNQSCVVSNILQILHNAPCDRARALKFQSYYVPSILANWKPNNNCTFQVKAEDLTLGDIVEIKFGDRRVTYVFYFAFFFGFVFILVIHIKITMFFHFTDQTFGVK